MPIPPPGAPIEGPDYSQGYAGLGLAGLAQGFTHGLEIGHGWGEKADELAMHGKQLENEAAWRAANLKQQQDFHTGELKNRADTLALIKEQAGKIGTPIMDASGNVIGYQTGKGGIVKPTPGKGTAKFEGPALLDDLSKRWDKLETGRDLGAATMAGATLKAKSIFPSTDAAQYNSNAQLIAGKIDHDLLGRVNDLTIANAKKSIPGFFDTPESKKSKMETLRKIYEEAGKGSTPAAQVQVSGPEARFNELIGAGKSKEEAFEIMADEGLSG